MMTTHTRVGAMVLFFAGATALCAGTSAARAQEAMYTEAATMPGPGTFVLRPQFHYQRFGERPGTDEERIEDYEFLAALQYGLVRDLSVTIDTAATYGRTELASGGSEDDKGVRDIDVMLKWRVYQSDTGVVDTQRVALLGGASIPSGDDKDFSSQSVNPMVGAVYTLVRGRHGFNQDVIFTLNTGGDAEKNLGGEGPSEALAFNTAYVYRFWPDAFTSASVGAWYVTAEVNNLWETNGDFDSRFAPGVMYEGRLWAFETMVQVPIYEDVDERPEFEFAVGFGFRFTF